MIWLSASGISSRSALPIEPALSLILRIRDPPIPQSSLCILPQEGVPKSSVSAAASAAFVFGLNLSGLLALCRRPRPALRVRLTPWSFRTLFAVNAGTILLMAGLRGRNGCVRLVTMFGREIAGGCSPRLLHWGCATWLRSYFDDKPFAPFGGVDEPNPGPFRALLIFWAIPDHQHEVGRVEFVAKALP